MHLSTLLDDDLHNGYKTIELWDSNMRSDDPVKALRKAMTGQDLDKLLYKYVGIHQMLTNYSNVTHRSFDMLGQIKAYQKNTKLFQKARSALAFHLIERAQHDSKAYFVEFKEKHIRNTAVLEDVIIHLDAFFGLRMFDLVEANGPEARDEFYVFNVMLAEKTAPTNPGKDN